MQANGGGHPANPLDCNFLPCSTSRMERDELKEIITAKQISRSPLARLPLVAGGQRLVDQVIAKNGRTRGTRSSDILPEVRLGGPSGGLVEGVIPLGNIGRPITGQTGEVQIQLCLPGKPQQSFELSKRGGIRLVWGVREFCKLQMNANDVRAQCVHFLEVL